MNNHELLEACEGLMRIVEEVGCRDWRDQGGIRFKDRREWVAFYVAVAKARTKEAQPAQGAVPVAWRVMKPGSSKWELHETNPTWLENAIVVPLHEPAEPPGTHPSPPADGGREAVPENAQFMLEWQAGELSMQAKYTDKKFIEEARRYSAKILYGYAAMLAASREVPRG